MGSSRSRAAWRVGSRGHGGDGVYSSLQRLVFEMMRCTSWDGITLDVPPFSCSQVLPRKVGVLPCAPVECPSFLMLLLLLLLPRCLSCGVSRLTGNGGILAYAGVVVVGIGDAMVRRGDLDSCVIRLDRKKCYFPSICCPVRSTFESSKSPVRRGYTSSGQASVLAGGLDLGLIR